MKIDKEKFEKTLIKNWTEFIDIREFLSYAKNLTNIINSKVIKLSITRFISTHAVPASELSNLPPINGFIVWIEYILSQSNENVNTSITSELLLDLQGEFHHIKSIINDI
jgi:hypothetical protein